MGVTEAIDLTAEQQSTLRALLRQFIPGIAVWAYGSRVRWTARPNSDLDLVAFTTPAQRRQVSGLKDALAESNLPFPVDLHVWGDVPERFREIIREDYVVVQEAKQQPKNQSVAGEWRETPYGPFAADFVACRLVDLCDPEAGIQTGPFGSQLHQEDYVTVGTPIITVEHLGENRILHREVPKVSVSDTNRLSRYLLRQGDIVFSRVGSVDRRALVRSDEDGWMFSGRCLRVRPDPAKIDSGYLSYFFGLPSFKEHVRAIAVGATMPSLNTSLLSELVIPYTSNTSEQRAIAYILGTLDDKIELNRRVNETLEAMARALFKSWFVDFDPVRAKAEGRDTGLPKSLADLFPDSFERSELGEIPKGWEVGTLASVSVLNPEVWTKDTRPTDIEYVDLSNTKWGRIEATTQHTSADAPSRAQRVLRTGDTIVGTVRPGNGSYALIFESGLTGSTGFAVLRPRSPNFTEFVYLAATRRENIEALAHLADGGAYPAVRSEVVTATPCGLSSDSVMSVFSRLAGALLLKIARNEQESRTLAALRDTLLPKLISGALRVKDAERFMESGCESTARNHESYMV